MNRLAFLSFTCQLGQEGDGGSLVNAATPDTHDARRLATHNADGMACAEQQHNDIS